MAWSKHTKYLDQHYDAYYEGPTIYSQPVVEWQRINNTTIRYTVKATMRSNQGTPIKFSLYINGTLKDTDEGYHSAGTNYILEGTSDVYVGNSSGTVRVKIQSGTSNPSEPFYPSMDPWNADLDYEGAQYTVTYDTNGGTGTPAPQTKVHDQTLLITTFQPTMTGHNFKGWATTSTGAVTYTPGSAYTRNADATLYAVWEPHTYTISYSANGGTGAPGSQTKKYGQTIRLSNVYPTREHYVFMGWNTNSSGTGTNYSAGGAYSGNASVTLYAKWRLETHKIYYSANGGTGAPEEQTVEYGTTVIIPSTKPIRSSEYRYHTVIYDKVEPESTISKQYDYVTVYTDYTFNRWNTRQDGTGTDYYPGQSIRISTTIVLYAIYSTSRRGSVALPTGTMTQWKVAYWSTSLVDPELHKVGDPYTPNKNITLYAIWGPIGTGGYLRIPSETGLSGVTTGSKLYLKGFHNPENDGPYTVASYSYANGLIELVFDEDFVFAGSQDTSEERLTIYGQGNIVPDFDYICALNNRLWGCNSKTRTIYASALGDPTDFWTFAGDSLDAYQVAVGSGGNFTGAVAMNNAVLFFKQHTIHKVLGSFPAEYQIYTYDIDGTSESNGMSAINCGGVVIYVTEHGIGTYAGSSAGHLSSELGEGNMNNSIAMYNGEQYFLHYVDDDGQQRTYIFDTRYNIWTEADYKEAMAFAHFGDNDFVLLRDDYEPDIRLFDEDGNIVWGNLISDENMQIFDEEEEVIYDRAESIGNPSPVIYDDDEEQIWPVDLPHGVVYQIDSGEPYDGDWEILFKPFYEEISSRSSRSHVYEKKRYTGITFRLELPEGSWIQADMSTDGNRWRPVARTAGRKERVQDFVIRTARCDKMQLRLSGHGPMTILSMEREYTIGSRR